jgi:MFS family permease
MFQSEVLPTTLRGPILAFFPIFFLLGQLISAGVVFGVEEIEGIQSVRNAIISQWPFSGLPMLLAFLIPESPVHLVRKGKLELALKAQQRLSSAQDYDDADAQIEKIQVILQHEAEQAAADASTTYIECFKGTDLRRTLIAMFSTCLPQLFGLSLLGQGAYFLQIGGMDVRPSMIFLLTGLAGAMIGNIISLRSLTRWGRRTLILVTMVPITLLYIAMGICGTIENSKSVW